MNETWGGSIVTWLLLGSAGQLAMVVTGHFRPAVAERFAIIGTAIAFFTGLGFAIVTGPTAGGAALGGAIVAGSSAFVGAFVSFLLKDVGASVLAIAALSGLVAGSLGGLVGLAL